MEPISNEPIAYNDHGDIPFEVPFSNILSTDISIYLQLNTKVGKSTCRQACAHCFFINQPDARGRSMDLREGRQVMDDLIALGYKVYPMISDSFANDGEFLRLFSNSHNREYHQGIDRKPTKTMQKGELWTSGAPLLDENWEDLLCLSLETGFGSVTITFHGVLDKNLNLLPRQTYPISGVFPAQDCERVIERINVFNTAVRAGSIRRLHSLPYQYQQPLQINLNVTIGKHNYQRQSLTRYVEYFNKLPISVIRFNRFHDHGGIHPDLSLSQEEVAQVYRDLKWIHTHMALNFQLGLDEDFGTSGIEVMDFPAHTGWCRAGRQLFAIVPDNPIVINDDNKQCIEKIGSIAGCIDAFKPIVGQLIRETDKYHHKVSYYLKFFTEAINELNQKRLDGKYSDGCFIDEMLTESQQPAVAPLQKIKI